MQPDTVSAAEHRAPNKARPQVGSLSVTLSADTSGFHAKIDEAVAALKRLEDAAISAKKAIAALSESEVSVRITDEEGL